MAAITKFDKPTLRRVGPLLLQALQVEAAKHGLKVEQAGGSFTAGDWTAKFKVTMLAPAEGVRTSEQEALLQLAHFDGFNAELLLKPTTILADRDGGHFRVVGYNPRAPKMPYLIDHDGRKQKCDAGFVRSGLIRSGHTPKDPTIGGLTLTDPPSRG